MRILHITNCLSEGGVETFLLSLLPQLREKGHEVDLLVLNRRSVSMKEVFEIRGIRVYIGKYSNLYNPLNIFLLKKYLLNYDIVHTHLWPAQLYVSLGKVLSNTPAKFVTTEHNNFNKRRRFKYYRFVEQWMYNQFDLIIGVCEASKTNLLKWINHSGVIAIHNGIQSEMFSDAAPYEKEELGLSSSFFMVTMTARFFPQKDQMTLIRAIALLPSNIHLVLVGSGETMFSCQRMSNELGITNRIHFLGRRMDVNRILKTSDLCVLSTHYEGLPISIIEYMAAGKAIIATRVDGVREMLPDNCLVEPDDVEDMAMKIKRFFDDKDLTSEIANQNLIRSHQYNVENMVNQYNDIYKEIK